MMVEFDHLFICTEVGAPALDAIVASGLTEGTPNTVPLQLLSTRAARLPTFAALRGPRRLDRGDRLVAGAA